MTDNKADIEQAGPEGRRVNGTPADLNEGLKFFNNRVCPFGHRAWWSLLEKEVEADYIHIDLGPEKPQWYVDEVNNYGTVPCLYDEGKAVFESLNVAEYLEERFPNQGSSLLPKDPWERALVREFISKIEIGVFYGLLRCTDLKEQESLKEKARAELEKLNARYSKGSKSGPFLLGERLSLADIAIIPFLDRFSKTLPFFREFDPLPAGDDKTERLRAALEAANQRPAFKTTSQSADFYTHSYRAYGQQRNQELRAQL